MLTVTGKVEVRCSLERAWDLFSRFGDVAGLIPSVEDVQVVGDRVYARLATRLGALPVSSRVTLEVVERTPMACLKAEGVSYLGETFREQIRKDVEGIDEGSVGRLFLHLDLRPTETKGQISVLYTADVEAEGRLKRIYQAILKTKVPSMMEEFAANIRSTLESEATRPEPVPEREPPEPAAGELALVSTPAAPRARQGPQPRTGVWARLVAWLRRLFGRAEAEEDA